MIRVLLVLFALLACFPAAALEDASGDVRVSAGHPGKARQVPRVVSFERVIDGDTFVADGKRIRLWGIDAPEEGDPASWASTWLLESTLAGGKELKCTVIEVDRYGREVMRCLSDGLDVGAMMVQMGMARDYKRYSGGYYADEEDLARREQRGIWSELARQESEGR